MSLVISQASTFQVLQISDRRLTKGGRLHDADSNKTILVVARNAIASLSYVGNAYMGMVPMDTWIVQTMTGVKIDRRFMYRIGRLNLPDFGRIMHRVATGLTRALSTTSGEINKALRSTAVQMAGWQWNKRGIPRPFLGEIKVGPSRQFEIMYEDRHWYVSTTPIARIVVRPKEWMSEEFWSVLLRDAKRAKTANEYRDAMVNAVRSVSHANDLVGPDCISVLIPPPGQATARVEFIPERSMSDAVDHMYAPWLVGEGGMSAPSIVAGGRHHFVLGAFKIEIAAIESGRWISMSRSQDRKGP